MGRCQQMGWLERGNYVRIEEKRKKKKRRTTKPKMLTLMLKEPAAWDGASTATVVVHSHRTDGSRRT